MDLHFSFSATTAQSLPGARIINHLYAKIALLHVVEGMHFSCTICYTTGWEILILYATARVLVEGITSNLVKTHSSISSICAFCESLTLLFEMANKPVFCSHRSTQEKVKWLGTQWIKNCCSHNLHASRPLSFASLYVRCIFVNSSYMYSAMAFTKSCINCINNILNIFNIYNEKIFPI